MMTARTTRRRVLLQDPEICAPCQSEGRPVKGHVTNTKARHGYRWRRHECPVCGYRWTSWQMVINPMRLTPRTPKNAHA